MSEAPMVRLRLYVAGDAQNSLAAIDNLHEICARHLPAGYQFELVDVLKEPRRALEDGVLMTPMLVKLAPLPVRRIVGSLSQTQVILQALGLPALAA